MEDFSVSTIDVSYHLDNYLNKLNGTRNKGLDDNLKVEYYHLVFKKMFRKYILSKSCNFSGVRKYISKENSIAILRDQLIHTRRSELIDRLAVNTVILLEWFASTDNCKDDRMLALREFYWQYAYTRTYITRRVIRGSR